VNQAALNLIAISIFGLTLSSLLGPLLNLSPFLPATLTVGLMGLYALDVWSWKGRGLTLVLDGMAQFSPDHRERVIHHEAGHFLVAHLLDISVNDYTLSAWEAFRQGQVGAGGVQFSCDELDTQLQQGKLSAQLLNRYGMVWLAGGMAETLTYGNAEGGADDLQKLRWVYQQLGRSPAECQQQERWLAIQVKTLLQTHWSAYEALVSAMQERTSVSACCQIIDRLKASQGSMSPYRENKPLR
jgi:hypothetical protein